ncbi:MAG: DinB family protein [Phycisphaeraceae bacterium]|nr:DinB family protein [Phycisphaeraceae bacterium]
MYKRFQRAFEFEYDADARVLRSLDSVPESGRTLAEFGRAVDLFAHIQAARHVWLSRVHPELRPPDTVFPAGASLSAARSMAEQQRQAWAPHVAALSDARLRQSVDYTSLDGGKWTSRLEEILTHLIMHGCYHRGQIAMLVKRAGGEPAITDWIVSHRDPR